MTPDPQAVAAAARDWAATAAALHEVADRLAAQAPEVDGRLAGRTGVVTAASLRRAVRMLREDAREAAAGGAALADVAEALTAARLDDTDASRQRLAVRLHEATVVMRRIHAATPPPRSRTAGEGAVSVTTAVVAPAVATHRTADVVAAGLVAGLLTAAAVRTGRAGGPDPASRAGSGPMRPGPLGAAPVGRGRPRRDDGSRSRPALPDGSDAWTDDEVAGPAVLG